MTRITPNGRIKGFLTRPFGVNSRHSRLICSETQQIQRPKQLVAHTTLAGRIALNAKSTPKRDGLRTIDRLQIPDYAMKETAANPTGRLDDCGKPGRVASHQRKVGSPEKRIEILQNSS
ncbi:MAG: hypothetical protein DMG11_28050 [Acidobacteria bacterium]|nr:MAG: hypothetical protein DMG11_28050 [Acidobacteriota bacterium]